MSDDERRWDVVVIGGGAAGLMAAERAATRGRRTLLIERNPRVGTKILMSGGTRCNLTHATDAKGIIEAYGVQGQGRFLHSALAALSPADLVALIEAEGVPTKIEPDTGKIFPASDRATDIVAALMRRLQRSGCELALSESVTELARADATHDASQVDAPHQDAGFRIVTDHRELFAGKVIVTTGGQSYPGSGSTGDGYRWLAALGHTIVTPRPALTPITSDAGWVTTLRGIAFPDVVVRVVRRAAPTPTAPDANTAHPANTADAGSPPAEAQPQAKAKKGGRKSGPLAERRSALLFTHFGLSGPAALDVSRVISEEAEPRALELEVDLLPDIELEQLDQRLQRECAAEGKKNVVGVILRDELPRRVVETLMAQVGMPLDRRGAEFGKAERRRLAEALKRWRIPVSGVRGFKVAEVTAGGVSLREVDSRTLESKLVPGLFLAGELLDLDGPIGGYNFQAAFSTAWLAGESV